MAELSLVIRVGDPMEFRHVLTELFETTIKVDDVNHNVDRKSFSSDEVDKLIKDKLQRGYEAGVRDGKAEAEAETLHKRSQTLADMVAYDKVEVSLAPGAMPFEFIPSLFTRLDKLTQNKRQYIDADPAMRPDTLGVWGLNAMTAKPLFITKLDYWRLCPTK